MSDGPTLAAQAAARKKTPRDPRLDFFRGLALFIILVAHTRENWLYECIPARFGVSDAADMFVFISGYAAAIAFGGTFLRHGMLIGTARVAFRCVQLYVAQIMTVVIVAFITAVAVKLFDAPQYIDLAYLRLLFEDPQTAVIGLFTFTYVPLFLNIIPMYVVVLAMIPAAMLLSRVHPLLVPAASFALWLAASYYQLNFTAYPNTEFVWYFNPLAWQAIFFIGFALSSGWYRVPADHHGVLHGLACAILVLGFLASYHSPTGLSALIETFKQWVTDHSSKTDLDAMRVLHFLASAYIVTELVRGRERWLALPVFKPIIKCGQQALPTFLAGIILATLGGMAFDLIGTGFLQQVLVNGASFAVLIANAYLVAFFKARPWTRPAPAPAPAVVPEQVTAAVAPPLRALVHE
jgi:hypothetical protein